MVLCLSPVALKFQKWCYKWYHVLCFSTRDSLRGQFRPTSYFQEWRDGTAVKSACCFSREPQLSSQLITICNFSSRGSKDLFSLLWAPALKCTYPYTNI